MDSVISFIFLALFFVAMMRFGCGAHAMGHGNAKQGGAKQDGAPATAEDRPRIPRLVTPERAVDPVCGRNIRTGNAKSSLHDGRAHYFCSRDCREIFEAAPESYPEPAETGAPRPMEQSPA